MSAAKTRESFERLERVQVGLRVAVRAARGRLRRRRSLEYLQYSALHLSLHPAPRRSARLGLDYLDTLSKQIRPAAKLDAASGQCFTHAGGGERGDFALLERLL